MEILREALQKFGLTPREIDIYLALLPLGTSHASVLARRTGMSRSTAQYTCQSLVSKGLAVKSQRKHTFLFTAEPPEKLSAILQTRRDTIRTAEEHIERVMGKLKGLGDPNSVLPKVQFYEGYEGIEKLYGRVLDLKKPICCLSDTGEWFENLPTCADWYIRTRIERNISVRMICPESNLYAQTDPEKLREVRTFPDDECDFGCHVEICGSLVSIFSFDEQTAVGIAINHTDIAQNFQKMFDYVWSMMSVKEKVAELVAVT